MPMDRDAIADKTIIDWPENPVHNQRHIHTTSHNGTVEFVYRAGNINRWFHTRLLNDEDREELGMPPEPKVTQSDEVDSLKVAFDDLTALKHQENGLHMFMQGWRMKKYGIQGDTTCERAQNMIVYLEQQLAEAESKLNGQAPTSG